MPLLTITKTYVNGSTLFKVDLDNAFDSISTLLNTIGLDYLNIQTGGIIGTNLANGTITSSQLGAASVNTSQLASSAVTTAIIGPGAVNTANIASSAVSRLNLAPVGQQFTASCGAFSTTNTGWVDVTNLSATITTNGRPVMLVLQDDTTGNQSGISFAGNGNVSFLRFTRDGIALSSYMSGNLGANIDPIYFQFLDLQATPGAHTFKVQATGGAAAATAKAQYMNLIVYELA